MSPESRRLSGILLVILPTVVYCGISILSMLVSDPSYLANPLRQDLWRANWVINFAYIGAAVLVLGLLTLGVGLLRRPAVDA